MAYTQITAAILALKNLQAQLLSLQANIEALKGGDVTATPASDISAMASTLSGLGSASAADIDTDDTMAADSDEVVPSQAAVKAYVAANAGGGGSSVIPVDIAFYSSAAALPAATTTAIDGVTVTNGMKCLAIRSSTSGQISKIYSAAVAGTDITWTDAELFTNGSSVTTGEQVYVLGGDVNKGLTYTYNGVGFGIPSELSFTLEGPLYNAEDIMSREMRGYRYLRRVVVKHQTAIGGTSSTVAIALDGTAITNASVTINAGTLVGSASVTIDNDRRVADGNVISFDTTGSYTGGGNKLFVTCIFI
jgi:hypothetical protein